MSRQIRTFIRSERAALRALAAVTIALAAVLGGVLLLGDQRRVSVVASTPAEGESVPSTIAALSLSFGAAVDRAAVERAIRLEPATPGTVRWRGNTLEYVPRSALPVGQHRLVLGAGRLGAGGERLDEPVVVRFVVRSPGVVAIVPGSGEEALVAVRPDGPPHPVVAAERIRDFAVAPDGSAIAVVIEEAQRGRLVMVDARTFEVARFDHDPHIDLGDVAWSADSAALLAVRRDTLPDGSPGVPRTWLVRRNGEFVAMVDPEGSPTQQPSWSPDAQWIAYLAPAQAQLKVLNLTTLEAMTLGTPRGDPPAWSPDSRAVAFASVPPQPAAPGAIPLQPVRVRSLDGSLDRTFGVAGEIRGQPRFFDNNTLLSIRSYVGVTGRGVDLVFESIRDGSLTREVALGVEGERVLAWDLDPSRRTIVYVLQGPGGVSAWRLELDTGARVTEPVAGRRVEWLP
jgi:hypothetical protein